jgi:DMSO/TMAO reductase YedYZ molybdopterin-dependent catalytic subunit
MRSLFRPAKAPDPAILDQHRPLIRAMQRRGLLRGGLSLGALTMLTGCDVSDDSSVHQGLLAISRFNDWVQAALFDPTRLAPEYPASMVQKPPRFNAYFPIEKVQAIDGDTWRLDVSGLVASKQPWTLAQINALPVHEEIIRHVCVEGWDYIGQWSGPTLRTFLEKTGADLTAKYVVFRTADDYLSCIDMPSALHPQTLLATKYAGETLPAPFGYPMRLRTAVKLGFKNPKWINAIEVTNTYRAGYWESRGFNWQSSL